MGCQNLWLFNVNCSLGSQANGQTDANLYQITRYLRGRLSKELGRAKWPLTIPDGLILITSYQYIVKQALMNCSSMWKQIANIWTNIDHQIAYVAKIGLLNRDFSMDYMSFDFSVQRQYPTRTLWFIHLVHVIWCQNTFTKEHFQVFRRLWTEV